MKQIVVVCLFALLVCACEREEHFITDAVYREMVEVDFQQKKAVFGEADTVLFDVFNTEMTLAEREALTFLYAYSPLVDISLSGGEFLLDNVRLAFRAREEMPWGEKIPEHIFRHFVLPVRGGKENLDTARAVFFNELKERVAACGNMERAALEVNHWCHENVIYRPTNARTSSPLAPRPRAYGRCGEESVFALAALRAVGIPARQIYTPRWAHCDDNHAWIEVWIDGEWKYLGACEPEPRLNIAWFTLPVQRAMYVEAEVFGKYEGDEEIVSTNENSSAVNVTSRYTRAARTVVQVKDTAGNPVENAKVEYKIFNYGEFYPVVTLHSDARGETHLTLGEGDVVVWASRDARFEVVRFPVNERDTLVVTLDKREGELFSAEFELVPPEQRDIEALTSAGERAENDCRFVREDSIRDAYVATFMTPGEAHRVATELGVDTARFARYINVARGNYREIERLFRLSGDKERAMALLDVVAEKDLQDTPADVWLDHLEGTRDFEEDALFRDYVLNPRVQNELITAFRQPIWTALAREGVLSGEDTLGRRAMAERLLRYIERTQIVNYPAKVATPPVGVLRAGVTDGLSRDIFFVALCRTVGIPARLGAVSGKAECCLDDMWYTVNFASDQAMPKGKLMLYYPGAPVGDPKYFLNFTIGKLKNGGVRVIDLGSNADVDMGAGASYSKIFAAPVELEAGYYTLSTGNRRSDGAVMAGLTTFRVEAGEQTDVELRILPVMERVELAGHVALPLVFTPEGAMSPGDISLPRQGYTAIAVVEADKEPTNHLLRDMGSIKDELERLGVPLYIVFKDKDNLQKFSPSDFRPFPAVIRWGHDSDGKLLQRLAEGLQLRDTGNLPLVVLVNDKGEVAFMSRGYRVGLGTQIMNVMNRK